MATPGVRHLRGASACGHRRGDSLRVPYRVGWNRGPARLLALFTATVSAASSLLRITLKEIGGLAAVVTGLQLPLTLLSGVLLPLSLRPGWLHGLGHVNPMYFAVKAAPDLAAGTIASSTVGEGFLIMGAALVAALWWGTHSYHINWSSVGNSGRAPTPPLSGPGLRRPPRKYGSGTRSTPGRPAAPCPDPPRSHK